MSLQLPLTTTSVPVRIRYDSVIVGNPSFAVLDANEAKQYAMVVGHKENTRVDRWLRAAVAEVQRRTGLILAQQTRDIVLSDVPSRGQAWAIPCAPLQSVTSLTVLSATGVSSTVASTVYRATVMANRGYLALKDDQDWPTDRAGVWPFTLRVVCGYASAAAVPADLVEAVGIWIQHLAGVAPADLDTFETIVQGYAPVVL